jgi:carbon monoxide dehydrogenase subunit G
MELTHSFTVPTSVDDAWALFMDLERVGGCFPGATVTEATDDGFSGTVKVKLGPIALLYAGSGSFVERDDAAHRAVIEAKGKDKRGNGTAGATVTVQLSPDGDGAKADVVTDLAVTGKPAQFGRGVMQDVSDKLLQAFVACIETQLTAGAAASGAPAADAAAAAEPVAAPSVAQPGSDASPAATAGEAIPVFGAQETSAPRAPTSSRPAPTDSADDALDLGSAVLPVLVQRYAGYAAAAAVGILIGWLIGRRASE